MIEINNKRFANMGGTDLKAFIQGAREPIDSAAQMLAHALPDEVNNWMHATMGDFAPLPAELDEQITQRKRQYEADKVAAGDAGTDIPYMIGNIVGLAPLAEIAPLAKGCHWLTKAAHTLGIGYAYGTLDPVTTEKDFWLQKHEQGKTGAIFVGTFTSIGKIGSKVFSAVGTRL